jgi:hypothetical protein
MPAGSVEMISPSYAGSSRRTLAFSPREKVLDVGGGYEDYELGVRLAASV